MLYLIFCFLLVFNLGLSEDSVTIEEIKHMENEVLIRCLIYSDEPNSYNSYLICPLYKRHCFIKCKRACEVVGDYCERVRSPELNSITSCTSNNRGDRGILFQYKVNLVQLSKLEKNVAFGNWSCAYRGSKSKHIQIKNVFPYFTTTKKPPSVKITKKAGRQPIIIEKISKHPAFQKPSTTKLTTSTKSKDGINIPIGSSGYKETDRKINKSGFKFNITRFEIIIIILIVLAISILINFVFCIRECLLKVYIENLKSSDISSKGLLCCLCQSEPIHTRATAKLDRVLSQEDASSRFPSPTTRLLSSCTPTQSIGTDNLPQSDLTYVSMGRSQSMNYGNPRTSVGMQEYMPMHQYPTSQPSTPMTNHSMISPNHYSVNYPPYYSISRGTNFPGFITNGRQYIPMKQDQFVPIRKPISPQAFYQTNVGQDASYNQQMPHTNVDLIQNCANVNNNIDNSNETTQRDNANLNDQNSN